MTINNTNDFSEQILHICEYLKSFPLPICITDKSYNLLFLNPSAESFWNINSDELVGKNILDFQFKQGLTPFINVPNGPEHKEFAFINKNNENYIVKIFYHDNSKIEVVFKTSNTYNKNDFIYSIINNFPGGMFKVELSENYPIVYANDVFYDILGLEKSEYIFPLKPYAIDYIYPNDLPLIRKKIIKTIKQGKNTFSIELRVKRKDDTFHWMLVNAKLLQIEHSTFIYGFILNITERKLYEQELKINEERYMIATSLTGNCIWEYDIKENYIIQSNHSLKKFGIYDDKITNFTHFCVNEQIVHPDFAQGYLELYKSIFLGKQFNNWIGKLKNSSGEYVWTKIFYTSIFDENKNPIKAIGITEDISDYQEAELRYLIEAKRHENLSTELIGSYRINLSSNTVEGIRHTTKNVVPNSLLNFSNISFKNNIGKKYSVLIYDIAQNAINQNEKSMILNTFNREDLIKSYENQNYYIRNEFHMSFSNGKILWVLITADLVINHTSGDIFTFLYLTDIDERKKAELALIEKAQRDSLTFLYNKMTAQSMISDIISKNSYRNIKSALIIIDIDNFKSINDTYGHIVGDKAILTISGILTSMFRSKDIIGRIGGDEFIVFISNATNRKYTIQMIDKLCQNLNFSFEIENTVHYLSCSVGLAFSSSSRDDFNSLLKKADTALYQSKFQGKNRFNIFNPKATKLNQYYRNDFQFSKEFTFDDLDEFVIIVDVDTHDVVYLNRSAREVFHVCGNTCERHKCYQLVHGYDTPCPFCNAKLLSTEKYSLSTNINLKLSKKIETKSKLMFYGGKTYRIEFMYDPLIHYTDCKHTQIHQTENILLKSIHTLVCAPSLKSSIEKTLKIIGEFYDAKRAYVKKIDSKTYLGNNLYEWCSDNSNPKHNIVQKIDFHDIPRWKNAFDKGFDIIVNDVEELKEKSKSEYLLLKKLNIKSLYAVPLSLKNVFWGYIGVDEPKQNLADISLIDSISMFVVNEISRRKLLERQLYLSFHDPLTGLKSRNSYLEYLSSFVPEAVSSMGVITADINVLKKYNIDLDNKYDDNLIKQIVDIFKQIFNSEYIFTFCGNEFVILCQDITKEHFDSLVRIAKSKIETVTCGACLGCTWCDTDINLSRMLNNSAELLEIEKQKHSLDINGNDNNRSILSNSLISHIKNGDFVMYLQPKVDIKSGKIVSAEALVRQKHPTYGILSPDKFIPIYENAKLISHIDFFMFEEVCKTLSRWEKQGLPLISISVNFSRNTLAENDFAKRLSEINKKYNVSHDLIEIEITESVGGLEQSTVSDINAHLRKSGFLTAIDDLGSKFTSLSLFSAMDFDTAKMDKSIINNITTSNRARIIVEHIIKVCQSLEIQCVAEGIETQEQFDILNQLGCDTAQGFLFNKPIPIGEFEALYLQNL